MSEIPYVRDRHRLRRKLPEFGYLSTRKSEIYRPILRYFFRKHEQHEHWLGEKEVLGYMREHFSPDYTLAECRQDLDALVDTRNLIDEFDDRDIKTIDDYNNRRRRYQLTSYTIAIERFLCDLEEKGQGGSLDTTLLDRLWDRLDLLRQLLGRPDDGMADGDLAEMHAAWEDAFGYYGRLRDNAADYLGAINRLKPSDPGEREALLEYKRALTRYLTDFINELLTTADRIQSLMSRWDERGWDHRLARRVAAGRLRVAQDPAQERTDGQIEEEVTAQLAGMRAWFAPRGDMEHLRRRTTAVLETITQNVRRLVERRRAGMSRLRNLEQAALAFSRQEQLDDAHRLFGVIFGPPVCRHMLGQGSRVVIDPDRSIWDQPPETVQLAPIARGQAVARGSSVVRDRTAEREEMLRILQERADRERALFDRLFIDGALDLAGLTIDDPEIRDRVLDLIGGCLASSDLRMHSDSGSIIELLVPDDLEARHPLRSADGVLWLPAYRLRRIEEAA